MVDGHDVWRTLDHLQTLRTPMAFSEEPLSPDKAGVLEVSTALLAVPIHDLQWRSEQATRDICTVRKEQSAKAVAAKRQANQKNNSNGVLIAQRLAQSSTRLMNHLSSQTCRSLENNLTIPYPFDHLQIVVS